MTKNKDGCPTLVQARSNNESTLVAASICSVEWLKSTCSQIGKDDQNMNVILMRKGRWRFTFSIVCYNPVLVSV